MSPPAVAPTRPELPEHLEQIELTALEHDVRLAELELVGGSPADQRARGVTFQTMRLTGTNLSGSQLEHVRIVDSVLSSCNMANVKARGARLKRCELRRSELTGVQGVESLRGLAMEWPDIVELAGVWAGALGIEVLES